MKKIVPYLLLLLLILPVLVFAQPGDPNGGDKPGVPISGIEILLALGGLFGASRFFRKTNKHE